MTAQLHSYDYKFMQMATFSGVHGTWSKVSAVREHLSLYDFVVFMDADTIFPHPHVPLEWLFNYWDIVPGNLIAMALDPEDPNNNDLRGRTLLKTGFIIAQKSSRAQELFTAWESCPQEVKYRGNTPVALISATTGRTSNLGALDFIESNLVYLLVAG
jgi:hypothetical protein